LPAAVPFEPEGTLRSHWAILSGKRGRAGEPFCQKEPLLRPLVASGRAALAAVVDANRADKEDHKVAKGGQSPINIARHLSGIDFPASKKNLIEHANSNKAGDDVIERLQQMPDRKYESMADVMKGVGDAK
jgi:hypothetical protein